MTVSFALGASAVDWPIGGKFFHGEDYIFVSSGMTAGIAKEAAPAEYISELNLLLTDENGRELESEALIKTGDLLKLDNETVYGFVVCGDADGDGVVSSADVRSILRAAVGIDLLSAAQLSAADLNDDGVISAADARDALRLSVNLFAETKKQGYPWEDYIRLNSVLAEISGDEITADGVYTPDMFSADKISEIHLIGKTDDSVFLLLMLKNSADKTALVNELKESGRSIEVHQAAIF